MMEGFGRILEVDLGSGGATSRAIPSSDLRKYIGGSTLGAYLLYDQLDAELDPLSPSAPLAFVSGPLTGTRGPAVGRSCAPSHRRQTPGENPTSEGILARS